VQGLLAVVDRPPLVRLLALLPQAGAPLQQPLEVLHERRRVAQPLVGCAPLAVEVLLLERALNLLADLLLLLPQLLELGGDALLDVLVEGGLAR
jgi:hypothetical protein